MNVEQGWSQWQTAWKQQASVDVVHLARRARRKRWQMVAILAGEWLIALFAITQTLQLIMMDGIATRWRVWGVIMMVLVAINAWFVWRLRRGTWVASAKQDVGALLDLSAHRARAGIRLAWANIVGVIMLVVISVILALPWLIASDWLHDPTLRWQVTLITGINTPIVIASIIYSVFYMRRQTRRLRWLRHVRAENPDTDG